jgi:hypothetical protein
MQQWTEGEDAMGLIKVPLDFIEEVANLRLPARL